MTATTDQGPAPALAGQLFWYADGGFYVADASDLDCARWTMRGATLTSPDGLVFTVTHTERDHRENELIYQDLTTADGIRLRVYND